jgi:hypothetical protein
LISFSPTSRSSIIPHTAIATSHLALHHPHQPIEYSKVFFSLLTMPTSRPAVAVASAMLALVLTLTPAAPPGVSQSMPATAAGTDEFVGPFSSWARVTTQYGAAGDGTRDDTAAIQRALDELGKEGRSPVLFLPAGTYRISRTLSVGFATFLSIVGEDPATTTLRWDGPPGGTMLVVNGLAYSRILRLTFDGRRRAAVAVEQSWDGSQPHFDTGNEYADDRFVDVAYGIRGGFRHRGFAETSVVRSHFIRNTEAGIALGNFNALNLWVWHATFVDCAIGVTNTTGAGNFHVYHSVFERSTIADLSIGNTGGFSARGNYSEGSRAFFVSNGATANPATIHLQGNTIMDTTDTAAIHMGNQGPGLLLDNTIQSPPAASGPAVTWEALFGADVTSIGNTYSVTNPIRNNGRLTSVDDRVVARSDMRVDAFSRFDASPNLHRDIIEVQTHAATDVIQSAIDRAAAGRGTRRIVHLPAGVYNVTETLTIPPGDLQLVGDGFGTILRWTGNGTGPVVRLPGPTHATLREIQIDGNGRANGLLVDGADQPGGRVFLQQVQVRHAVRSDLVVDGLDDTHVQLQDFGHAYSPHAAAVRIAAGPRRAAGERTSGRVSIFSGASSGNRVSYDVSNGARVLVRDLWYESGAGPGFVRVSGRAEFTADGVRAAPPTDGDPAAFAIDNLDGRVTILSTHLDDGITMSGTGHHAEMLALGVFCEQRQERCYRNVSGPPARGSLLNSRHISLLPWIRSVPAANVGTADADFLRTMLRHTREEWLAPLTSLPPHVTDVRMFRVLLQRGLENIRIAGMASRIGPARRTSRAYRPPRNFPSTSSTIEPSRF